jgi:hypothetical protein
MRTDRPRAGGFSAAITRYRWVILAVVSVVAVATTLFSVIGGGGGGKDNPTATLSLAQVTDQPYYLFRSTTLNRSYGTVAVSPAASPDQGRAYTTLKCIRVAFASGRGLCLSGGSGLFSTPQAIVFDAKFQPVHRTALVGYPSRAQVSDDGRYGATTTFVSGDSYASQGFSTRSDIIDMRTGQILLDLEKLKVYKDGVRFENVNFNFWGVTFAPTPGDQQFYATLGSGSETYLIEGDVTTQTATVLRAGVECPSLSPDGKQIAFKKRLPGAVVTWRLSVLELSTLVDHPLAETRSVDDQAVWLNNSTVAYGLLEGASSSGGTNGLPSLSAGASVLTDTWTVPADGTGRPRLLIEGAWATQLVQP